MSIHRRKKKKSDCEPFCSVHSRVSTNVSLFTFDIPLAFYKFAQPGTHIKTATKNEKKTKLCHSIKGWKKERQMKIQRTVDQTKEFDAWSRNKKTEQKRHALEIEELKSFLHVLFSCCYWNEEVFCHLKFAWNRIKYAKHTLFTIHKVWYQKPDNIHTHTDKHTPKKRIRRKAKEIPSKQWHNLIIHDRTAKHMTTCFGFWTCTVEDCGEIFTLLHSILLLSDFPLKNWRRKKGNWLKH